MNVSNCFNLPIRLNSERKIDPSDPEQQHHLMIHNLISSNNQFLQNMEGEIEQMGQEQFYVDYLQNIQLVVGKFQVDSLRLRDKALFQILHRLMAKVYAFYHVRTLHAVMVNQYDEAKVIQVFSNQLQILVDDYNQQKKHAKLQAIQKNFKLINF